jgi:serine/threonine-protein kinase HipA
VSAREIVALLEGRPAATITESSGKLRLRYIDSYPASGATPLSVNLPTQVREHTHEQVSAFLWGLLPDNERKLCYDS